MPCAASSRASALASVVPPSRRTCRMADMAPLFRHVPWLTIIGVGEDGADGLGAAARAALAQAELVMGPARHLSLLPAISCPAIEWPVPFADGMTRLMEHRGARVVMLASGDPFWFGA